VGFWRLIGWIARSLLVQAAEWASASAGSTLAADREREDAAEDLREHYVRGSLTLDEFSQRAGRVVRARSHRELRAALSGLSRDARRGVPVASDPRELIARGRSAAHAAVRSVALVLFTGAYLVFSLVLVLVLALTLLLHGASASALLAFLLVWLFPTYLLSRLWRGRVVTSGRR
jgi:hypothetical protein